MQGIHTALLTPFTEGGAVDWPQFEAQCARQLDAGIHGLVACGTTGETPTLERQEWAELIRTTARVAAGRVPVTAGVGTNDTRSTLHNIEMAADLGATAGLLVFPYYNKPNPDGLLAHVRAALSVGLPLVLYHVPGRTAQRLPVAQLAELAELPGVIAIKEATGDVAFGSDLATRTSTPVLSGDDFTFLGLYSQGGVGAISVLSNVAPGPTVAIHDAFFAGDVAAARDGLRQLWPIVQYLFSDTNPVPCKALMAALGHGLAHVRLPLAPLRGDVPADLVARCRALGLGA